MTSLGNCFLSSESLTIKLKETFDNIKDYEAMSGLLENWFHDPLDVKGVFIGLARQFSAKEGSQLTFTARPGVSFSLKAFVNHGSGEDRLFGLVDIVDDDPENRWLSVCFYDETITDPRGAGNLIPDGLLGEDGYCFDLFEDDGPVICYVNQKIDEAYRNTRSP